MKTVTLLNEKGGVGKTTLATHIAGGLAIRGYRVVLADGDSQGQAGYLMGLKKQPGLYNLLIREDEFEDVLRPISPEVYSATGSRGELWVLPGNLETRAIMTINPNPFILRERLKELDGWADVVVFDTSPTPSPIHSAIYMATDSILIPTNLSFLSLDGLAHSILHQEQAQALRDNEGMGGVTRMGIIPTMYRKRTEAHDIALQQLMKEFRRLVWPCVPLRTIWEKAALAGELLFKYAPFDPDTQEGSEVTEELWALIDRVEQGLGVKTHG